MNTAGPEVWNDGFQADSGRKARAFQDQFFFLIFLKKF